MMEIRICGTMTNFTPSHLGGSSKDYSGTKYLFSRVTITQNFLSTRGKRTLPGQVQHLQPSEQLHFQIPLPPTIATNLSTEMKSAFQISHFKHQLMNKHKKLCTNHILLLINQSHRSRPISNHHIDEGFNSNFKLMMDSTNLLPLNGTMGFKFTMDSK